MEKGRPGPGGSTGPIWIVPSVPVVVDPLGLEPVLVGLRLLLRVAHGDDAEGHEVLREVEDVGDRVHPLPDRGDPDPHRAEPQAGGREHEVLGACAQVLLPELRGGHQVPVAQYDDRQRGLSDRSRVGRDLGQLPYVVRVVHHDELPGLLVPGGGCVHGGLQDAVDLVLLYLAGDEVPDADSGEQLVHNITGWESG